MKFQIKQHLALKVLLFNFLLNLMLTPVFHYTGLYDFQKASSSGWHLFIFYIVTYSIFAISLLPYVLQKVKSNGFVRGAIFFFTGFYHILYSIHFYAILPYFIGLELIFILIYFSFKNYIDEIKQKKEI